jgi:glycosyltransferase involved in cell wall biosynthesis
MKPGTVLWWGRFDPDYSRNRILRQAYTALGWNIVDFHPLLAGIVGDVEALVRRPPPADLVHLPCFRQRDMAAATRYARRHGLPLLIDPLTSAYDKQVYEKYRLPVDSLRARWLLRYERWLFSGADRVLADTPEHARFFTQTLGVDPAKVNIVYVGAEEPLFAPAPATAIDGELEVLFFGSFIPLQGPEVIVEAARLYQGPPLRWTLLGQGPLRADSQRLARGLSNVHFEDRIPYRDLPARIHRAHILLGVFGPTAKAGRVMPNKVFQALACGRPLVTCRASSYPDDLLAAANSGIAWVPAADPAALAAAVAALASQPEQLAATGVAARASYEKYFSTDMIREQLRTALAALPLTPVRG